MTLFRAHLSPVDLLEWLSSLGLAGYAAVFESHGFDSLKFLVCGCGCGCVGVGMVVCVSCGCRCVGVAVGVVIYL